MSFPLRAALAGVLAIGAPLAAAVAPAAARVTGDASFRVQADALVAANLVSDTGTLSY
jgi:hypothetical protein